MRKVKLITIILGIVLICAVSFVGVYTQVQNRMENQVKDYDLGMGLTGARILTLTVSEEEEEVTVDSEGNIVDESDQVDGEEYTTETQPVNSEEILTKENYEKTKAIIKERLAEFGVTDYVIKMDEETGKIILELPEDSQTDHVVSNISEIGKFEIVDSETEEVLMDNDDIKESNVLYSTLTSGTIVYLNIEFTKEGAEKLKNISIEYATIDEDSTSTEEDESTDETTTDEDTESTDETTTDDDTESEEEEEQKEITIRIDGSDMITTSFDETMENGSIQLSMGSATTDTDQLNDTITSAATIATLLDTGNLPIEYEIYGNEYVEATITSDLLIKIAIGIAGIMALALLVLVFKFKGKGILTSISYIGLIAVYLLVIRYTNVQLTLEGITAIVIIYVLNYIFMFKLLSKIKKYKDDEEKIAFKEAYTEFGLRIVPICILSIGFCFINWSTIASFGMAMFWGLTLSILYNMAITNNLLKRKENK